jgi:hypothetical protein
MSKLTRLPHEPGVPESRCPGGHLDLRQTDQNGIDRPDCILLSDNNDRSMAWKPSRYAAVQPPSLATAPHLSIRAEPESP